MIKLDTPHESFVGGWHIDEKICDDLIQLFKDNKEHQKVGVSGGPFNVQKNVKDSIDLGYILIGMNLDLLHIKRIKRVCSIISKRIS
ncbi:MAG: hypothetical protein CM15mV8_0880 [Caudoviricetes sp.]|nr:MAG: hypothetical protein CM15mV8_0880 [Caudoviricetes sp.]